MTDISSFIFGLILFPMSFAACAWMIAGFMLFAVTLLRIEPCSFEQAWQAAIVGGAVSFVFWIVFRYYVINGAWFAWLGSILIMTFFFCRYFETNLIKLLGTMLIIGLCVWMFSPLYARVWSDRSGPYLFLMLFMLPVIFSACIAVHAAFILLGAVVSGIPSRSYRQAFFTAFMAMLATGILSSAMHQFGWPGILIGFVFNSLITILFIREYFETSAWRALGTLSVVWCCNVAFFITTYLVLYTLVRQAGLENQLTQIN